MIRLIADLMAHQKTRLTPLLKQMAQGVCDQCSLVTVFFFFFSTKFQAVLSLIYGTSASLIRAVS